jgi:hypothetical protein
MYDYTKSSSDQVLTQADKFLSVENDPLEDDPMSNFGKKEHKIIRFPNFSSEVMVKLIKVDIQTENFNCDKFDFIQ